MENEFNFVTQNVLKVKDIMTRNVITILENSTIKDASIVMRDRRVGVLVVLSYDNKIMGVISERDIINKVVSFRLDPGEILVKDIMTRNIIFGNPDMTDVEATLFMSDKKIKKLPILSDGNLVGIITQTDLMKITINKMENMILDMVKETRR